MYWVRVAARLEDNAALDVAAWAAKALRRSLLIVQTFSPTLATDRLSTFFREGARELEAACAAQGLSYRFLDERSALGQLAKDAALVVVDVLPISRLVDWDTRLARLAPVWRVDASTLTPHVPVEVARPHSTSAQRDGQRGPAPLESVTAGHRNEQVDAEANPRALPWSQSGSGAGLVPGDTSQPLLLTHAPYTQPRALTGLGDNPIPGAPVDPLTLTHAPNTQLRDPLALTGLGDNPVLGATVDPLSITRAPYTEQRNAGSDPLATAPSTGPRAPAAHTPNSVPSGHPQTSTARADVGPELEKGVARVASEVVAQSLLDHTVGPVHHTRGGVLEARTRWNRFLAAPADVEHPALRAALHFGFLSPQQLARDAASAGGARGETVMKAVMHRELAIHRAMEHLGKPPLEALSSRARDVLKRHERRGRTFLPSWEQLARAQTGDLAWDAAQRHLMIHGELSPVVRDVWVGRVVDWTRTTDEAFTVLLGLLRRYALDGYDPGAWLDVVEGLEHRAEELATEHAPAALSIDVSEFERRAHRPSRGSPLTVAVVGAGISGLAAARALTDAGHVVRVFEAGDAPGGRLKTLHEGPLRFDLGVPCFTVRDERFALWARAWWQERVLNRWNATIDGDAPREHASDLVRLVGVPDMDSLSRRLALGIDVRLHTQVKGLTRDGSRWRLLDAHGHALGEFDVAVIATPAPIAAELVDPSSYALGSRLRAVTMQPSWVVALHFPQGTGVTFDGALPHFGPLQFISRNSTKPERPVVDGESFVLHATGEWTLQHLDARPEEIIAMLLDAFFASTGVKRIEPTFQRASLWKWATTLTPLGTECVWDAELQLAVCGDWCLDGQRPIEHAFLSGSAAAGHINALPPGPLAERDAPVGRPAQLDLLPT